MSSHNSFSVSSSSPTKKKTKWDFRVEFHGAILLLVPLSDGGLRWIAKNISADNGYQPYYPTVIIEPRSLDDVLGGIRMAAFRRPSSRNRTARILAKTFGQPEVDYIQVNSTTAGCYTFRIERQKLLSQDEHEWIRMLE